jgi:uncharacterized membrane protein
MWQSLRRSFITGFFVIVPLVVSVVALVWVFRAADSLTSGLTVRLIGRHVPGLGLVTTALIVLAVGAVANNVFGRRVLQRGEDLLMHVPVFRTIYAPVKQLVAAFSPDNELGFKRMVMVEDQARGLVLGFLTREFVVDRGRGPERLLAVYVPTNHLYLGDVIVCPAERASFPDLTVEQGLRIFLTGGVALPSHLELARSPQREERPHGHNSAAAS